jgi:hypothetical protein
MRAIQADRGGMALTGLVVALLLLLLWIGWFLFARISIYERGPILRTSGDGLILAEFPAEALERLHPGQVAWVRPTGAAAQTIGRLPAYVIEAPTLNRAELHPVELYVEVTPENYEVLANGFTGQVEVEVEQLSPAVLILRATGQLLDTPRLAAPANR